MMLSVIQEEGTSVQRGSVLPLILGGVVTQVIQDVVDKAPVL